MSFYDVLLAKKLGGSGGGGGTGIELSEVTIINNYGELGDNWINITGVLAEDGSLYHETFTGGQEMVAYVPKHSYEGSVYIGLWNESGWYETNIGGTVDSQHQDEVTCEKVKANGGLSTGILSLYPTTDELTFPDSFTITLSLDLD